MYSCLTLPLPFLTISHSLLWQHQLPCWWPIQPLSCTFSHPHLSILPADLVQLSLAKRAIHLTSSSPSTSLSDLSVAQFSLSDHHLVSSAVPISPQPHALSLSLSLTYTQTDKGQWDQRHLDTVRVVLPHQLYLSFRHPGHKSEMQLFLINDRR